jgi:DNA-binding transcriptional regulator YiaG
LDSNNLKTAYDIYRKKHGILTPTDIQALRHKYGLSQRGFSTLLGWGEITIHRYENGSLPDEAHSRLLQFLDDPENMWKLYAERGDCLPIQARTMLRKRLAQFRLQEASGKIMNLLELKTNQLPPNLENGNRPFSIETTKKMMCYFTSGEKGIFRMKLNKLLFYADFTHFRLHSVSISGSRYVHLPVGPIPEHFQWILSSAMDDGLLESQEAQLPNGHTTEILVAPQEVELGHFCPSELAVLEGILDYFSDTESIEISELSHQEKGYSETKNGEIISYDYANRLKVRIPVRRYKVRASRA